MSHRWWTAIGVGLAFALAGPTGDAAAEQPRTSSPSRAPYQIMAAMRTQVRVDVGQDRRGAEALRQATVIAPAGAVAATLIGTKRICKALCGEEDEKECHYEAVLRLERPVEEPLAVFAGRPAVSGIARVSEGPARAIGSEAAWLDASPLSDDGGTYRWTRLDDGVFLTFDAKRDFYSPAIALTSCKQYAVDVFTRLSCQEEQAQLLYDGSHPIVVSFDDYGPAAVQPLVRLRLGDQEAVLIHLGLKAQMVVALLVKEGGQWTLDVRAAEYGLMC